MKKKRTAQNPPAWLVEAYNKGDKTQLAQMLVDANFSKDWAFMSFYGSTLLLLENQKLSSPKGQLFIFFLILGSRSGPPFDLKISLVSFLG